MLALKCFVLRASKWAVSGVGTYQQLQDKTQESSLQGDVCAILFGNSKLLIHL